MPQKGPRLLLLLVVGYSSKDSSMVESMVVSNVVSRSGSSSYDEFILWLLL